MKGLLCICTDLVDFFLCICQNKVIYIKEYFKFSSLRSKFVIGVTDVEITNHLTQILDFRQILSSLRIM